MLMARAWIALELTDSGLVVGAVTFAGMIPWLVAPIGGALADRYDRAKLIAAAASLQIVQALGLAALSFAGVIEVWHLILFAIVNGVQAYRITRRDAVRLTEEEEACRVALFTDLRRRDFLVLWSMGSERQAKTGWQLLRQGTDHN